MSRNLTKRQKRAVEFSDALCENEEHMGEGAAMALTCDQFGLDWMEGPLLLADHPDAIDTTPKAVAGGN